MPEHAHAWNVLCQKHFLNHNLYVLDMQEERFVEYAH